MFIRILLAIFSFFPLSSWATFGHHSEDIYHRVILETAGGKNNHHHSFANFDIEGWIGGDYQKLWLKIEGEYENRQTDAAEFWLLSSYYLNAFWDAQIGIRHDTKPYINNHVVLGFQGLAPYFLETAAYLFVSERFNVSLRVHQEYEILITQQLILEPFSEINFFLQDIPRQRVAGGFSDIEIGIKPRYEITRKFAPYIDIHYHGKLGKTRKLTKSYDTSVDEFKFLLGLRLLF